MSGDYYYRCPTCGKQTVRGGYHDCTPNNYSYTTPVIPASNDQAAEIIRLLKNIEELLRKK
jgi:hypothetical protein